MRYNVGFTGGKAMGRVIISGGGTGGHIYPAITIARQLQI